MYKASNLFALFSIFVLTGVAAIAQTSESVPPRERLQLTQVVEGFGSGGSYLGIQTQEVTKENFSKFGLRAVRGVAVEKVLDDSPAKQAGLQDGDVIVRFNGEEVTSYRKLTRLINETAPDHQAKLTVSRGGNERDVTVTVGKRPTPKFEMGSMSVATPGRVFERTIPAVPGFRVDNSPQIVTGDVFVWNDGKEGGNFVFGSTKQIGVSISGLTKQLGEYFGVSDGKGILINNVAENSPAAKAGIKAGDVIIEAEGKPVNNSVDLIRGINEKKEGEVTLTILRNRNRQTVKVTPEKMKEGDTPFRGFGQSGGAITMIAPRVRAGYPSVRTMAPARITAPINAGTIRRIL